MGALTGVRVIDMSSVIAGPFAANLFSDFGAEVIKIEMPGKGDSFRQMGPYSKDGKSIRWSSMSRNKKSITLDLHYEEGKKIFLDLVAKSDVIIENFRTGTLNKWGLDMETLKQENPKIVVTRITGYGQTGPRKFLSGFGTPCTAFSGVTYCCGYPDRPPVSPSYSMADYNAGLFAVVGTMIALYNRDVLGGAGQEIDVSLYESLFRTQETIVADYFINNNIRERTPKMSGSASPSGTFQTKDGKWVVIVCSTDRTFSYIANAWDRDDLKEKYAKTIDRLKDDAFIMQTTADWVQSLDYKELLEICTREGVPIDLIYSIEDIFNDEHYAAREDIVEVPDHTFGTMKMPAVHPILSKTPGKIEWAGPKLGAYNDEIYKELLGLDDEKLKGLQEQNII